jgi:hypothetical protein
MIFGMSAATRPAVIGVLLISMLAGCKSQRSVFSEVWERNKAYLETARTESPWNSYGFVKVTRMCRVADDSFLFRGWKVECYPYNGVTHTESLTHFYSDGPSVIAFSRYDRESQLYGTQGQYASYGHQDGKIDFVTGMMTLTGFPSDGAVIVLSDVPGSFIDTAVAAACYGGFVGFEEECSDD